MRLKGAIPPMVTPITDESFDVNEDVLRSYTEFLVDGDVHGLFPCGTTGEFPSLSREQRRTVIETVTEVAGDVPVLAGCGDTNVDRIDTFIQDAESAGADAAVVVTPYYLETTQESLLRFFRLVADRSSLPVVLYEIPSLTGLTLNTETVSTLAEHENIIGMKTSIGDFLQFYGLVQNTPPDFDVLPGFPELAIQSLNVGGNGFIAGPANVFPTEVSQLYEYCRDGHTQRAVEVMNDVVLPVLSTIRPMPTVPALKYLLQLRGFDVGPALPPMPELSDSQRRSLEVCLEEV